MARFFLGPVANTTHHESSLQWFDRLFHENNEMGRNRRTVQGSRITTCWTNGLQICPLCILLSGRGIQVELEGAQLFGIFGIAGPWAWTLDPEILDSGPICPTFQGPGIPLDGLMGTSKSRRALPALHSSMPTLTFNLPLLLEMPH